MGKRHNTLTDDIFRNSKYIHTLEQVLEIEDFRKEYKEQYDIMLDVYKTLITINNIFFSDSNKSKKQKQNEIKDTLEKVIYKSIDDNRAKYSVRTIKGLIDSNTRLLYNKFNEWYENLSYNEKYYDNLKLEVEEEMDTLDNIDFDNIRYAVPAFLTIVMMPLTYSITNGIGIGVISYFIINIIIYLIDKFRKVENNKLNTKQPQG